MRTWMIVYPVGEGRFRTSSGRPQSALRGMRGSVVGGARDEERKAGRRAFHRGIQTRDGGTRGKTSRRRNGPYPGASSAKNLMFAGTNV